MISTALHSALAPHPTTSSTQPPATRFGAGAAHSALKLTGSAGKGTQEGGRNWLGNWIKAGLMFLIVTPMLNKLQSQLIRQRQKLVGHLDHHLGWNVQTTDAKGKPMPPPKFEKLGSVLSYFCGYGSTDQIIPERIIGQNK